MIPKLLAGYRSPLGHALLSAVLLWMALPPLSLGPLAWIAPLWWIILIRRQDRRYSYRVLWLAGFLFWMAAYHWLRLPHWTSYIGWVLASFYLGFYLPLFVALSRVAVHRLRVPVILAAPIVWIGLELARAYVLTGVTMGDLGHTQFRWITLIQISDLTGAYGVSFVVMWVAACLARMIRIDGQPRAWWPIGPAVAMVGAVLVYGTLRTSGETTEPGPRIALIQGSIPSEIKSDESKRAVILEHYWNLSRKAVAENDRIDLLVWPETMFRESLIIIDSDAPMPEIEGVAPEEVRRRVERNKMFGRNLMTQLARRLDVPLLLGVDRIHLTSAGQERFNSAVYIDRRGVVLGWYDKNHLVLIGEYVPLVDTFPWLQNLTPLPMSLDAGEKSVAFPAGDLQIAPSICYETVLPHVIRRQVRQLEAETGTEPDVLVNLTNDGWFHGSSELDMHLVCAVFRAIECRKPIVIAANTGFSAWIDGDGVIRDQGRRHATDILIADVERDRRESWYSRHGDWFSGICLALCLAFAVTGLWERRFGTSSRVAGA